MSKVAMHTIDIKTNGESSTDRKGGGTTISFHNINYEVNVKKRVCSKPTKKIILNNMT